MVFVPLAVIRTALGESHKYVAMPAPVFHAVWLSDDSLMMIAGVGLMFASWAIVARPRGWVAAARISLLAFRKRCGTMARFVLQYVLIFAPAFSATSLIAHAVRRSLVRDVALSIATGLIATMSMTIIALAYIHLTGEGAGRSETADNETPSHITEVQTP